MTFMDGKENEMNCMMEINALCSHTEADIQSYVCTVHRDGMRKYLSIYDLCLCVKVVLYDGGVCVAEDSDSDDDNSMMKSRYR